VLKRRRKGEKKRERGINYSKGKSGRDRERGQPGKIDAVAFLLQRIVVARKRAHWEKEGKRGKKRN